MKEAPDNPILFLAATNLLLGAGWDIRWTFLYAIHHYLSSYNLTHTTPAAWHFFIDGCKAYILDDDLDKGIKLLQDSCSMDFLPAFKELSDIYFSKGDTEKAILNIKHAEEEGYIPAVHQAGYYHYTMSAGKIFQYKTMKQAAFYFFKGANLGFPISLWTIGELYLKGYGNIVAPDPYLALEFLQAAVEAGETAAVDMRNKARTDAGTDIGYVLKTHSYPLSSEKALYEITINTVKSISGKETVLYPDSNEYNILHESYRYWENRIKSMEKGEIGYDLRRMHYSTEAMKLIQQFINSRIHKDSN